MRKFLGVFFMLITTVLGIILGLSWALRATLLDSSAPLQAALRDGRVYDKLLSEFVPQFVSDPKRMGDFFANAPIDAADVTALVRQTLTATFLQTQVEHSLTTAYDLLHSRTDIQSFTFVIPLQDLKRRLPAAIHDVLVAKLRALPTCTSSQLADFAKRKQLDSAIPPCLPKGVSAQSVIDQSGKIDAITANLPDTYDVAAAVRDSIDKQGNTAAYDTVRRIVDTFQRAENYQLYATILWLLLVLGIGALFLPHWARALRWFGVAVFIPSALLGAGAIIGWGHIPATFTTSDALAQVAVRIFQPVGMSLAATAYHRLLVLAGCGVALAIAAHVAAYFVRPARLKT